MLDLRINQAVLESTVTFCRDKGITLPTFAMMRDPRLVPDAIKQVLADDRPVGRPPGQPLSHHLEEPAPGARRALRRRQPHRASAGADRLPGQHPGAGGTLFPDRRAQGGRHLRLPRAPAGHRAVRPPAPPRPSGPPPGNFCRGGAYISALLACQSIAILPEGMSRERFEWLSQDRRRGDRHPRLRVAT